MLSASERETIEAMADRIIPTDAHGPGAVQAGVVVYIERALSGEFAPLLDRYRAGVSAIDAAAVSAHGIVFAQLAPAAQDEVLGAFEQSDSDSERDFFETVRAHVLEGFFGDPSWGGNIDQVGWALLSYPGPRKTWTEHDQQLDVLPGPE